MAGPAPLCLVPSPGTAPLPEGQGDLGQGRGWKVQKVLAEGMILHIPCPVGHQARLRGINVSPHQLRRSRDSDPASSHLHQVGIYPHVLWRAAEAKPPSFLGQVGKRSWERKRETEEEGEKNLLAGFQGPKPEWKYFPSLNCFETR